MNLADFPVNNRPLPTASTTANSGSLAALLARMLDEIDYGLVLVGASGLLHHANQLAQRALHGAGPLHFSGGMVVAAQEPDHLLLKSALADAARGLRRLLTFGTGAQSVSIAVLPLTTPDTPEDTSGNAPLVMLVFGKQPASETLTLDFFARAQRLTTAEASVLHALCAGHRPKEIARQVGVAISTVRTQIGSIRIKTQTRSIRDLINKVANLPPITPAMKTSTCH